MGPELAIADVEGFVIDEEADHLAIGHIDHRLPGLRIPVTGLRVGKWAQLVDAIEIRTG